MRVKCGRLLSVVCCLLFRWLFIAVRGSLFVACCLVVVACCLLIVVCWLYVGVCCSLFAVCCLFFVV